MRFLRLPLASIRHYATVSPYPISLRPSIHEIQSGRLTKKNVQAGLEAFQRDGVVVLENVVHHREDPLGSRRGWVSLSPNLSEQQSDWCTGHSTIILGTYNKPHPSDPTSSTKASSSTPSPPNSPLPFLAGHRSYRLYRETLLSRWRVAKVSRFIPMPISHIRACRLLV